MKFTDINRENLLRNARLLFFLFLGNVMIAFAVCAFVIPYRFMLGGSTGIALVVNHFIPLRISVITAISNTFLFIMGYIFLGKKFAAASLFSSVLYPVILGIFEDMAMGGVFVQDRLLAAVASGIIMGVGVGFIIRAGGSSGGMDIPPCILQRYKGIPVGNSMIVFDLFILLSQISYQGISQIMYSVLIIVLTGVAINRTIILGDGKVQVLIISDMYRAVAETVMKRADCGATFLQIETAYKGEDQKAVLCVIPSKKYPLVKKTALEVDDDAFIVTSSVVGVNGRGYTLAR